GEAEEAEDHRGRPRRALPRSRGLPGPETLEAAASGLGAGDVVLQREARRDDDDDRYAEPRRADTRRQPDARVDTVVRLVAGVGLGACGCRGPAVVLQPVREQGPVRAAAERRACDVFLDGL